MVEGEDLSIDVAEEWNPVTGCGTEPVDVLPVAASMLQVVPEDEEAKSDQASALYPEEEGDFVGQEDNDLGIGLEISVEPESLAVLEFSAEHLGPKDSAAKEKSSPPIQRSMEHLRIKNKAVESSDEFSQEEDANDDPKEQEDFGTYDNDSFGKLNGEIPEVVLLDDELKQRHSHTRQASRDLILAAFEPKPELEFSKTLIEHVHEH